MESHEWPGYGSDHPAETTRLYTSRVEFSPKEGSLIEFQSRVSHTGTPIYKEGDVVTVVYEPASPEATAEIAGPAVWQSAVFAGLAAFLLLCVTVGEKACG